MTDHGVDPDADDALPDADADVVESYDGAWPVALAGVTESVVTTLGPNDRWNVAALGLHAPEGGVSPGEADADTDAAVEAVTWGNTRTRRNFHRRAAGVVQFVADPRDFVDAALTVREESTPVLDSADAWVRVSVESVDEGTDGDTDWERWRLHPEAGAVRRARPFTINRALYAVVDATVAASRLDVPAYDTAALLDRLSYFAEVVDRCGGPAEREAFERLERETGWREY